LQHSTTCVIDWNTLSLDEWHSRFAQIRKAPLTQSYEYAIAASPVLGQTPRWGVIKINNKEAGLIQIMEAGLFKNALHGVNLDFGPLWFKGCDTAKNWDLFLTQYNKLFPRRFGRKRRCLFNKNNTSIEQQLTDNKYKKSTRIKEYETIWIDLKKDQNKLLENLDSKQRNRIRKTEKKDVGILWDQLGLDIDWLLKNYMRDRLMKNYAGASPKLIRSMCRIFGKDKKILMGTAIKDGEKIGAILIFYHGKSATYQIGWSSDIGRKHGVNAYLLWNAFAKLKGDDIHDFDLGGINNDTAQSIKKFKQSFGGEITRYSGLYT